MAALAVTLELGVKILVPWTVRIGAVQPFRVRAFDGKAVRPLPNRVSDGQRVGYVVAGCAHLRADKHRLVISLVLGRVDFLVGDILSEDLAGVNILLRRANVGCQRPKAFRGTNCVRRKAIGPGANAVSQVRPGLVGPAKSILLRGCQQFRPGLYTGGRSVRTGAAEIVVERRVPRLRIGVAHRADDSALPRIRIAILGSERGEGDPGPVVGGGIEVWVTGS